MIEPLHIATVGGRPLRFFRTPLNDGRPDLPWHSVDDLYGCLGLKRAERQSGTRTVAMADGIITVAPHYHAWATINAAIEFGLVPTAIRNEFDRVSFIATCKLGVPYPLGSDGWTYWMCDAMRRWDHAP